MVLCSHLEYPICDCVHSKFVSPCETPLWNMSLVARTKQWTAPELNKNALYTRTRCPLLCLSTRSRPCTWAPAPWPNFSVGSWKNGVFTLVPSLLKKGVFTLVPSVLKKGVFTLVPSESGFSIEGGTRRLIAAYFAFIAAYFVFKSLFVALFWHLWLCGRASYFISDHLLLKNLLRTLASTVLPQRAQAPSVNATLRVQYLQHVFGYWHRARIFWRGYLCSH